ncbi:hypothetical protein C4572_04015 [Candidatus Parcubacteria bacterium]|nr:MAG: hypothetical protein C4572_04015 [Candidatus Parcubacteria bacterium]
MTQAIKNLSLSDRLKPAVFNALVAIFFVVVAMYVYFVGISVFWAAEDQRNLKKISQIDLQKIELEKRYLDLVSRFDAGYAAENGFIDQAKEVIYVSRADAFARR